MRIVRAPRPANYPVVIPKWIWTDERLQTAEEKLVCLFLVAAPQMGIEADMTWLSRKTKYPEWFVADVVGDMRAAGLVDPDNLWVTQ